MTTPTSSPRPELLELVTLAEFLIRNGPQGAAAVATERFGEALLEYYRCLPAAGEPEVDGLRRETLRLWSEVRLVSDRLRVGPMRRGVPPLRRKVEGLLLMEAMAAVAAERAAG